MIELTKEIFCGLAHNVLKHHEKVEIEGDYRAVLEATFLELIKVHPELAQIFYIQKHKNRWYLWHHRAWLTDVARREKITKDRALYDEVLEERKRAFRDICTGICDMMGFEKEFATSDMIKKLAHKVMERKKQSSGEMLGVDLVSLRELPGYHTVLDDDGKEDYRV